MPEFDVIVIGGGMIGMAIAYGLVRLGKKTLVLDEGDVAFRAARGNFGLVWVQGKGLTSKPYADWTSRSADIWADFNTEISQVSGVDTGYSRPGGFHLCLSDDEFEEQTKNVAKMTKAAEGRYDCNMLDRDALVARIPELGGAVVGGSFSPMDGHVNPLYLLRAMYGAFIGKGGRKVSDPVVDLQWDGQSFDVITEGAHYSAEKVVLAAGLGSKNLGSKVGLKVPVSPQRGQILVTEKIAHFLDYPTIYARQTEEGSVLLGDSHEDVGFNDGTSPKVMGDIARRGCQIFPHLAKARIVRAWGALRILTPDGLPVYDQSTECPGAFSASAHSGVTLAAAHALDFASFVVDGVLPDTLNALSERRFHVH